MCISDLVPWLDMVERGVLTRQEAGLLAFVADAEAFDLLPMPIGQGKEVRRICNRLCERRIIWLVKRKRGMCVVIDRSGWSQLRREHLSAIEASPPSA